MSNTKLFDNIFISAEVLELSLHINVLHLLVLFSDLCFT